MTMPETAMVMAAGLGTRMRPLTDRRPKPLIEVNGETLLDHVLVHLRAAGVARIVVNVHYLADQIEAHLAEHAAGLEVAISDERGLLLETGGGLIKAKPLLKADPFFCVNTDNVWTDEGANAFVRLADAWNDAEMDVLMLLIERNAANNHSGRGDFDMDRDGRISRQDREAEKPWVWTGIQLLSQRILRDPPSPKFSTNVFWDRAIAQGRAFGLQHRGRWFDVGTPQAIARTEALLGHG